MRERGTHHVNAFIRFYTEPGERKAMMMAHHLVSNSEHMTVEFTRMSNSDVLRVWHVYWTYGPVRNKGNTASDFRRFLVDFTRGYKYSMPESMTHLDWVRSEDQS